MPLHLRNAATGLMRDMGYGGGYQYAHNYAEHYSGQRHLPDSLPADPRYYVPGELGYEGKVKEWMEKLREGGT